MLLARGYFASGLHSLGRDQSPAHLPAFPLDALFSAGRYVIHGVTCECSLGAFADPDLGRLVTAGSARSAALLLYHYNQIRVDKVDSGARLSWQRPHPQLARRKGSSAGP